MQVCVHRGTKQIGGTCIEPEQDGSRLILDLGLPLDAKGATPDLLPPVGGFRSPDPSLLGVILSHPHQDHHGLMQLLPATTPLFMGAAAERIIAAAALFIRGGAALHAARHLVDGVPLDVGPFRVTPFLIDHSAFDSYAFEVQSGGKRLFYSGDLRGHGRKAALFERLVSRAPRFVDALLLEGSSIGRLPAGDRFPTEGELEDSLVAAAAQTRGAVLVCASAQNIDRVVTVFRAARRSHRVLVIDLYGAFILAATGNENIPQSDWPDVRLFVPEWQRRHVKRMQLFDVLRNHAHHRVYPQHLAALAPEAIFLFRSSMATDLERAECLDGAQLVWSQWDGYLADPRFAPFLEWQQRLGVPMERLHTSGHASITDLQHLADAISAKCVVPIHSFESGRYAEFFSNVECHNDGERWAL
jgi:ribonuclease J